MYLLILRNDKGHGFRAYYDHRTSKIWRHFGAVIEPLDDSVDEEDIEEFFSSLRTQRKLEDIEGYEKFKPECTHCPIVQICKGRYPDSPCDDAYKMYVIKMAIALKIITGFTLERIEGYILRP